MIGLRWMGQARVKEDPEMGSGIYLWAVLMQLMFIAVLPFSTMLVGRWDDYPATIWVYSGNVGLSALAAIAVSVTSEKLTGKRPAAETGRFSLLVLVATAILSVIISFWSTRWALGIYALNLFTQFFQPSPRRSSGFVWARETISLDSVRERRSFRRRHTSAESIPFVTVA
jgi:uncharacterized membrane protein